MMAWSTSSHNGCILTTNKIFTLFLIFTRAVPDSPTYTFRPLPEGPHKSMTFQHGCPHHWKPPGRMFFYNTSKMTMCSPGFPIGGAKYHVRLRRRDRFQTADKTKCVDNCPRTQMNRTSNCRICTPYLNFSHPTQFGDNFQNAFTDLMCVKVFD